MLMYRLIKKQIPYHTSFFFKCHYVFSFFSFKILVGNQKYIVKITNHITKPQLLTIIKMPYTGIK